MLHHWVVLSFFFIFSSSCYSPQNEMEQQEYTARIRGSNIAYRVVIKGTKREEIIRQT